MFTADLRRGEAYKKAKKCIAITILDFNLDERKAYHKKNPVKEKTSPLDEWHSLFNAKTEEDLDMIKSGTKNRGIIEAIKEL